MDSIEVQIKDNIQMIEHMNYRNYSQHRKKDFFSADFTGITVLEGLHIIRFFHETIPDVFGCCLPKLVVSLFADPPVKNFCNSHEHKCTNLFAKKINDLRKPTGSVYVSFFMLLFVFRIGLIIGDNPILNSFEKTALKHARGSRRCCAR